MGSSNRHWPSMFKSKPCNTTGATSHHQWQHDINSSHISPTYHRTPYSPAAGCEERTPEPKPRWNPRPEQIRILESIFNSGIVNPPRDEIRKIRAQLQEYGQVGDANVFYWFQNRKSRSKHKQRHLQTPKSSTATPPPQTTSPTPLVNAGASSSSSSTKSSPNSTDKSLSIGSATVIDLLNSPTGSVNQPYFSVSTDHFLTEPFFFPVQKTAATSTADVLGQGFCFPDVNNTNTNNVASTGGIGDQENCPSFLLSELMLMNQEKADDDNHDKLKMQTRVSFGGTATSDINAMVVPQSLPLPNPTSCFIFQGDLGPTKSTVFINDVCFEVGTGPFNVKEAFGDDAVLIHSSGHPVLTNVWGLTLQPLQHNAFYYLVRTFAPSPVDKTMDLS